MSLSHMSTFFINNLIKTFFPLFSKIFQSTTKACSKKDQSNIKTTEENLLLHGLRQNINKASTE